MYAQVRGIVDPESGVRQYYAAIGDPFTGNQQAHAVFRSIGTSGGEMLIGGIYVPDGHALVTVRAVNGAKEKSEVGLAIGVDTRPPFCESIVLWSYDPAHTLVYTDHTSELEASWNCSDETPWSHVPISCEWAIASFPGGDDLMPWTAGEQRGRHTYNCDECFENGRIYFVNVRCTDQVGWTNMSISGGIMPDLQGPTISMPATVVTRYTGRATEFWGFPTDLGIAWGFDDLESGVHHIRALLSDSATIPITGPKDVQSFRAMPLALPIRADQRQMVIPLADQGITLHHNTRYYLHVCAEDGHNWTSCSEPHSFLVDLTPPHCRAPDDRVAGLAAPPIFSRRAGFGAFWECRDEESGVMFTSWAGWKNQNEPLLTRRVRMLGGTLAGQEFARGTGSRSVAIKYVDGTHFHSCISATNGAELYSVDECSGGAIFDGSAPRFAGELDDGPPYQQTSPTLCTQVPLFYDNTSSLREAFLEVMEQVGDEQLPYGAPLRLNLTTQNGVTVCRNVSLVHGSRYFSRLLVSNNAQPSLTGQRRAQGFRTDDTPPISGSVKLRLSFPRRFEKQANFPSSVRGLSARVLIEGFSDDESGIHYHSVKLLLNGTVIASGLHPGGRAGVLPFKIPMLPEVLNGSFLQAEVVSFNRVGMDTGVIASPNKQLHLGAIYLEDPWFTRDLQPTASATAQQVAGMPEAAYMIPDETASIAFQLAVDPMTPDAKFEYTWALTKAPCDADEDSPIVSEIIDLDVGLVTHKSGHASDFSPSSIRGHTNDMILSYYKGPSRYLPPRHKKRDAVWAKSFQPAGLVGEYCALVTACIPATYFSDGTLQMPGRCKNATSAPITFSTTVPVAKVERLCSLNSSSTTAADGDAAPVATEAQDSFPMQLRFSCDGAESPIVEARLSLGTSDVPGLLLDNLVLNETSWLPRDELALNSTDQNQPDANQTRFMPPVPSLNVTGVEGIFFSELNSGGFTAAALLSKELFEGLTHISELNSPLVASLQCVNSLNVMSSAISIEPTVLEMEPPLIGMISFPDLVWSSEHRAWLGALVDSTSVTIAWSGFSDTALRGYSICVVRDASGPGCDVEAIELASSAHEEAQLTNLVAHASNGSSTLFLVTLEVTNRVGLSSSVEVELLLDHTVPIIGNLTAGALASAEELTGALAPAEGADQLASGGIAQTALRSKLHDTVVRLELVGGAFDDDVDEPLSVRWSHRLAKGPDSDLPLDCSYRRLNESAWVWAAYCKLTSHAAASELCFSSEAVSIVGLTSRTATRCVNMRLAAPVWPKPPLLSRSAELQLNASWEMPIEPYGELLLLCFVIALSPHTPRTLLSLSTLPPTPSARGEYHHVGALYACRMHRAAFGRAEPAIRPPINERHHPAWLPRRGVGGGHRLPHSREPPFDHGGVESAACRWH